MGHSNKKISKHKFVVLYSSHVRSIAEKYSYRSSENHEKLQRFRFMLNEKCIKLELLAQ